MVLQSGDGDTVSTGSPEPAQRGCNCEELDTVMTVSAWEQMMASRVLTSGETEANGRQHRPTVRILPSKTLDLRIFCGTWNVADRMMEDGTDIAQWLDVDQLDSQKEEIHPPHIFVVGFQEVVELSAHNVVIDSFLDTQSRANSLKWFTVVYAFLLEYGHRHGVHYSMLSEHRLLGTYILVMATDAVQSNIRHVQSVAIPTGLGGVFGNKGAVAVRMEVAGTSSLCFVCAHMAAHRENVQARNAEYKLISSRPVFSDTSGTRSPGAADPRDFLAAATKHVYLSPGYSGYWGSFFGGVVGGQVGRGGGTSPNRDLEVKKAMKAISSRLPGGGGIATEGRVAPQGEEGTKGGLSTSIGGSGSGSSSGRQGAPGGKGSESGSFKEMADVDAVETRDAAIGITSHNTRGRSGMARRREDETLSNGLPKTMTVLEADIVFWLGDLNYRIKEMVPDEAVFDMVARDDLETLRTMDQLNLARAEGDAFSEFQEGPLCFPPTYKYIPGTRELDQRPEKKTRCPSWTDRVLYSVGIYGGDSVRRLALDRYWSSGVKMSDHMPVSALFRTSLKCSPDEEVVEPEIEAEPLSPRKAAAAAAFEATPHPKIALAPPAVAIRCEASTPATADTEIKNNGGVAGEYHICEDTVPEWMSLSENRRGKLAPGETARLVITVDKEAAAAASVAVAVAATASGGENAGHEPTEEQPSACAVLRIEVDSGGSGSLLPIVCSFDEELVAGDDSS